MKPFFVIIWLCLLSAAQGNWLRVTPPSGGAPTMMGDFFIPMNTSSPGTTLTAAIMNAGTVGNFGAWTFSPATPTGLTVGAHNASCALQSQVIVAGTVYPASTTTTTISLDNTVANIYAQNALPAAHQTVVHSLCLHVGPPVNNSSGSPYDLLRYEDIAGNLCILQLIDGIGIGSYGVRPHSALGGSSVGSTIVLSSGGTYNVSLKCDQPNSLGSVSVSDTVGNLIGSSTVGLVANGKSWTRLYIGNVEVGAGGGTTTFEDQIIDLSTGRFPMVPSPTPPIYFVASASAHTIASGSTVAATLQTTSSGDTIWCPAFWGDTTRTASVADVANGAYTAIDSPATIIGTYKMQAFYKTNIVGATTPAITLTLSGAASTTDRNISCHIIHGVTTLDKHPAVNTGTSATMVSAASGTTTSANEYLGGFCVINGAPSDPYVQSGISQLWNLRELANFENNPSGDSIVTSTGSYTFTAFQTTSTTFGCLIDTFQ